MSRFVPVSVNQFVERYVHNNPGADGRVIRDAVEDALAAWRQGVRCACGNPLWVAGSAVAGYGCFACIAGAAEPDGDPEIADVCDGYLYEMEYHQAQFDAVDEIMRNHPHDYRRRLEQIGFEWHDDADDQLYEEEAEEERVAVVETENQRRLVRFLDTGGPVTPQILDVYLKERYAESSNLPLVRKYFKQANANLKAILMAGLAENPTDADLLDDLAYFSEFDSILGELIQRYAEACVKESDMERFSQLAKDFHINTIEHGFDALRELARMFTSGTKGAVIQYLSETIDETDAPDTVFF